MFNFEFSIFGPSLKFKIIAILLFPIFISPACNTARTGGFVANSNLKDFPPVILWAWERPEDLRFLDTEKFGVAFLAQTLVLRNDEVVLRPRRQPLAVKPGTFLIAVTRIETDKFSPGHRPALSDSQKNKIIDSVIASLDLPNVRAVQIDFDALASERDFYRLTMIELRRRLPADVSLTMTALASWCVFDNWFADFPVDEAVPMAFRMGADARQVREFLVSENDWREPLCRGSYGVALDEPIKADFNPSRRFYVFNNGPWRPEDLKRLPKEVSQ